MRRPYPLARVFGWPAALAVISGSGLVLALLGDGAWDWIAWPAVAAPLAAAAWMGWRRRL